MSNGIDIKQDYFSFKAQTISKLGNVFKAQADLFFERAIHDAENGLLYSAVSDARFALELSQYAKDIGYEMIYMFGFLTQISLDVNNIIQAKYYYNLGEKMLDKNDINYESDKKAFAQLKEMIDGESWKENFE
jgi:hypothetical protein